MQREDTVGEQRSERRRDGGKKGGMRTQTSTREVYETGEKREREKKRKKRGERKKRRWTQAH